MLVMTVHPLWEMGNTSYLALATFHNVLVPSTFWALKRENDFRQNYISPSCHRTGLISGPFCFHGLIFAFIISEHDQCHDTNYDFTDFILFFVFLLFRALLSHFSVFQLFKDNVYHLWYLIYYDNFIFSTTLLLWKHCIVSIAFPNTKLKPCTWHLMILHSFVYRSNLFAHLRTS